MSTFSSKVSRLKARMRSRFNVSGKQVSSVDVTNILRSSSNAVHGPARGAVVRRVFNDLVNEGFLVETNMLAYNHVNHRSVRVYKVA